MAKIGERIGPFELAEEIRVGERTTLFRGARVETRSRYPEEVAIRVANPEKDGAPAPEVVTALREEYDLLRLVQDERIPTSLAFYTGHSAVALEHVRGATLRDTLRLVVEGRLDLDAATAIDILLELAYALRHAHEITRAGTSLVHGMVSAEVVRLLPDGHVRLLGLADPEPGHRWPRAPERAYAAIDARTDQWLLGALGVELLRHAPEVLDAGRGAPVSLAFGLLQSHWPAATRIFSRMLSESPDNRYESEERMIQDLLALGRQVGTPARRAEVAAKTVLLAPLLAGLEPRALENAQPPPREEPPPPPAPVKAARVQRARARAPAAESVPAVSAIEAPTPPRLAPVIRKAPSPVPGPTVAPAAPPVPKPAAPVEIPSIAEVSEDPAEPAEAARDTPIGASVEPTRDTSVDASVDTSGDTSGDAPIEPSRAPLSARADGRSREPSDDTSDDTSDETPTDPNRRSTRRPTTGRPALADPVPDRLVILAIGICILTAIVALYARFG